MFLEVPQCLLPKVEFCAGAAQFTRAMVEGGYNGKRFDESLLPLTRRVYMHAMAHSSMIAEVRYSENHNYMRTIGFLALLSADPWLQHPVHSCRQHLRHA